MKFSMRAFISGVNGGNFLISMPIDSKTKSNLLLKSGSRSWIRYFFPSMKPSHISHMFLAICVVQSLSGLWTIPPRHTSRLPMSIKNSRLSRTSPNGVKRSTWAKSVDAVTYCCVSMNWDQSPRNRRSGSGTIPFTSRICRIVVALTLYPRYRIVPAMCSYPQSGLLFASCRTFSTISGEMGFLPRFFCPSLTLLYFASTRSEYHFRIVPGAHVGSMVASRKSFNSLPFRARRRLSESVSSNLALPVSKVRCSS